MKNKFMTTIITAISTLCISASMFSYAPTAFASDSQRNVSSPAVTELLMGDTDGNGTFNVADILTFKNWMLSDSDNSLDSWRAADFSWDGRLNIVDYCLMKNALLSPSADANVYDLLFGYYENGYSKPLPSQKIALKCKSFCNLNEKLTIDVAMGDESSPDYDALGHAEYGIYAFEGSSYMNKVDEKLIINGENSKYKKIFSKDELESLDISGKFAEYGSYHHETAEIDFSNYKPGDSGEIVLYFHWEYDEESPNNPNSKTVGMDKIIGFYVGEEGIALGTGADDAKNRYQNQYGSLPDDITSGYYDKDYSKPLPSQKIALKCKSFCNSNEKITVDAAMGDEYSLHQKLGNYPNYDTPGHAEYGILAADEKLIINGENNEYKKVFSKNELESLDISGKFAEYDSYHHEASEIDFSNYKPGDSGEIVFYFHWVYEYENPYDPANKTVGMDKVIGFYVGEKGIAFGTSADDAMNRYQELFTSSADEDNEISSGYYDKDYSKPLPSQKIAVKCNSYGNLNEIIAIDAAMGDEYSLHQKLGNYPNYDTPGHAEYGILAADEKLIINGENNEYKKVFSKDVLESLDISGKFAEYESYHHETAKIDFSNCTAGDSGDIVFYFHWVYEEENPYDPANKSVGMSKNIGYYIGEKGISFGANADDAMNRYQELFSLLPDEDISIGYIS